MSLATLICVSMGELQLGHSMRMVEPAGHSALSLWCIVVPRHNPGLAPSKPNVGHEEHRGV